MPSLFSKMKHNKHSHQQNSKSANPSAAAGLNQNETDFVPAPDEVARRAYFRYENQGSVQGNHVEHWLAAESELIAESKTNSGSRLS